MVKLLVALVAALLIQSAPYHVYLPFIAAPSPRKGLAGHASDAQMAEVNATWRHGWALCPANAGAECVDVSKGFWAWEEYGEGPDEIDAALAACRSGWFMFGDEWQYQDSQPDYDYPISQQIAEAHWYIERRAAVNPACRLAFGGILTFHPYAGGVIAADWVPEFYSAYVAEYGEPPDIDAIVFDDFWWPEFWYEWSGRGVETWEDVTVLSVNAAHGIYGDIEIWTREVGGIWLFRHDSALEAMDQLETITRHYDRYAWFISQGSDWDFTALWTDGELTDLGEMYQEFEGW